MADLFHDLFSSFPRIFFKNSLGVPNGFFDVIRHRFLGAFVFVSFELLLCKICKHLVSVFWHYFSKDGGESQVRSNGVSLVAVIVHVFGFRTVIRFKTNFVLAELCGNTVQHNSWPFQWKFDTEFGKDAILLYLKSFNVKARVLSKCSHVLNLCWKKEHF